MMVVLRTGVAIAVTLVAACQTPALTQAEMSNGSPALLSNPSLETRSELTEIISKAMNGRQTVLAPDVLTASPSLIIERAAHKSIYGNPMMGRRMDKPDHFSLSLSGKYCILTHQETGTHYALKYVKCKMIS